MPPTQNLRNLSMAHFFCSWFCCYWDFSLFVGCLQVGRHGYCQVPKLFPSSITAAYWDFSQASKPLELNQYLHAQVVALLLLLLQHCLHFLHYVIFFLPSSIDIFPVTKSFLSKNLWKISQSGYGYICILEKRQLTLACIQIKWGCVWLAILVFGRKEGMPFILEELSNVCLGSGSRGRRKRVIWVSVRG